MRFHLGAQFPSREVRIGDVTVAEQLIKAARDLIKVQSLNGQGLMHCDHKLLPNLLSNTLEFSEAFLALHLTLTDTSLSLLHPLHPQGFLFASSFPQGKVGFSPRSTRYSTSPSSSLYIRLHFPSIQWLITLLQQTTKTKVEQHHNSPTHQADLHHSNQYLRLLGTLQQQLNQQLHIYRLTLQRQHRIQAREENRQWKNRRHLKPTQSSALQNSRQQSWALPRPSVRYVKS